MSDTPLDVAAKVNAVCELFRKAQIDDETVDYVASVIESERSDNNGHVNDTTWIEILEPFVDDAVTLQTAVDLLVTLNTHSIPQTAEKNNDSSVTLLPATISIANSTTSKSPVMEKKFSPKRSPKVVKKTKKKKAPEPKRALSGGRDELGIRVNLENVYFTSGEWEKEFYTGPLSTWDSARVVTFVRMFADRMGSTNSKQKQKAAYMKVANILEGNNVDGCLLNAGGYTYLTETIGQLITDTQYAKHVGNAVWKDLSRQSEQNVRWKKLGGFYEVNGHLLAGYTNSSVGDMLHTTLSLYPLESIEFASMVLGELDVNSIDSSVGKLRKMSSRVCKVVSVAKTDAPNVVRKNFIYTADNSDNWCLVASVDFERHGEAAPGHWHINRAPEGDLIPHFYELESSGKGGVFHGEVDSCPLWWLMIPSEKTYWRKPVRWLIGSEE